MRLPSGDDWSATSSQTVTPRPAGADRAQLVELPCAQGAQDLRRAHVLAHLLGRRGAEQDARDVVVCQRERHRQDPGGGSEYTKSK
jgi:hypothetical protein